VREKTRACLDRHVDPVAQRINQSHVAAHGTQIKTDTDIQQLCRFGLADPALEVPDPRVQSHTPSQVPCHHLATAEEVAGGIQPLVHKLPDLAEIRAVGLIVQFLAENDGIVLIGIEALLLPSLRTERNERKAHRGHPCPLYGQIHQSSCGGIADDGR